MAKLIGQNIIMGLQGQSLTSDEKAFITENDIGGVCLFARNVSEPMQVWELCNELQSLRPKTESKAPLIISIDMEGGRVHRLKPPFTQWPALAKVGALDSPNVAYNFAQKMGDELRAVGINLNFAPCVDILSNPENKVIGDRSISSDPEQVAKISSGLVRGYIKAGVIPCAKHFPGHGNTFVDSHEDLPREAATWAELSVRELVPFKKAFKARLDLLMTGHLLFENVDPENPVTFSSKFLRDFLREELRYRGLVISDDLDMGALRKYHSQEAIPVKALSAGCDILLYCNDPESPLIAVDSLHKALAEGTLNKAELEQSRKKILDLKAKFKLDTPMINVAAAQDLIGSATTADFAAAIVRGETPPVAAE